MDGLQMLKALEWSGVIITFALGALVSAITFKFRREIGRMEKLRFEEKVKMAREFQPEQEEEKRMALANS